MTRKLLRPEARASIKISLQTLFDFEFQKNWYDSNYKHAFSDSLSYYVFDSLYDHSFDTLCEPYKAIGVTLYNEEEAAKIREFEEFYFNSAFWGAEEPDDFYVNHSDWPKLIERAREIVAMMEVNEKKYDFDKDNDDFFEEQDRMMKEEFKAKQEEEKAKKP